MTRNWTAGVLTALALALAAPAAAQPWRYVDKDGVHYTNNPYELPPAQQKKALEQLERSDARRAAQQAEREAKAAEKAAQAAALSTTEGLPPPVATPVVLQNGPDRKPVDPKAAWRTRLEAAQGKATAAKAAAKAAEKAADAASRRAFTMPSGPNFAANQQAQDALKATRAAAVSAEAEVDRVRKSEPGRRR